MLIRTRFHDVVFSKQLELALCSIEPQQVGKHACHGMLLGLQLSGDFRLDRSAIVDGLGLLCLQAGKCSSIRIEVQPSSLQCLQLQLEVLTRQLDCSDLFSF